MAHGDGAQRAETATRALYRAYNAHDVAAVRRLYAEDATHEDVTQERVTRGRDAVCDGLARFFAAFPDAHWVAERIIGDGHRVTGSYQLTGTLQGRLGPFEPRGQRLQLPGVHVVETDEDGLIVRTTDFWNPRELAQQLNADGNRPLTAVAGSPGAPEGFLRAMRLLAGGVAVVTTVIQARPWGLTVSACCSLTADPPQVLVSLGSTTASCRAIVESGRFGVALLGADQVDVARVCSAPGQPKFIEDLVATDFAAAKAPVIAGALAHLDCSVVDLHEIGDHVLMIGLVEEAFSPRTHEELEPLVYFERAFRTVGAALR